MTLVNSALNLLNFWRNFDTILVTFTVLTAMGIIFLIKRLFSPKAPVNVTTKKFSDSSEDQTANPTYEKDSQDDVIKKVVEVADSDNDCSELFDMQEMEADYESTIDVLQTLGKLHGKLATAELRAKTKKLEQAMSEEQLSEEREIKQKQLESIFSLMMAQGDKFGLSDKDDLEEQMKLYAV